MRWYLEVLKKYAVFSGRARRKEYWLFVLFNVIIAFVLAVIDVAAGLADTQSGWGLLGGLYTLAILIPSLAVLVRRLHDTDHSGWWLLILLVPIVGVIVLLLFMVRDGQAGQNRFGRNPKELAATNPPGMTATAMHIGTQAENATLMAFCTNCGTKFPEVAAYCSKCGARRTA